MAAAMNLLTNFEETLAAMGVVESNPAWLEQQKIRSTGSNVTAAQQFLEEIVDLCSGMRSVLAFMVASSEPDQWVWIVRGDGEVRFGKRRGDDSAELHEIAERARTRGFAVIDWQPP